MEKEPKEALLKKEEIQSLEAWGKFAMQAGVIPQGTTQFQAMAIIQTGREMGLQPLQSLRSMNFIRGRLVMSVQLQLSLARRQGVTVKELVESEGSCEVCLARGDESITCQYTLQDAKKAGLVRQDGSYDKYARQMLRWRAIGDALRLIAPDTVMGLLSPEEAENLEPLPPATLQEPPKTSGKPFVSPPVERTQPEQGNDDKGGNFHPQEGALPEGKPQSAYADMLHSFAKAKAILGEKVYRELLLPYKKANEIKTGKEGQAILDKMSAYLDKNEKE